MFYARARAAPFVDRVRIFRVPLDVLTIVGARRASFGVLHRVHVTEAVGEDFAVVEDTVKTVSPLQHHLSRTVVYDKMAKRITQSEKERKGNGFDM